MDQRLFIAILLGLLWIGWTALVASKDEASAHARWRSSFGVFLVLSLLSLVAWRWRSLNYNGEINVDESQVLSQAMRYLLDPLPWRSVDGGSSGPLNTWAVLWAPLVGLKLDYLAARITSLACIGTMFAYLVLTLREVVGARFSFLFAAPAACFIFTTTNLDFAFFSSEQLPSALSAAVVFLLVRQWRSSSVARGYWIGLLTGALPFCKIQVGPAAVLLFGAGVTLAVYQRGGLRAAFHPLAIMALGGITVPALILLPVALGGAWEDFLHFYIKTAIGYRSKTQFVAGAGSLIFGLPEFGFWFSGVCLLSMLALGAAFIKKTSLLQEKSYWFKLAFATLYAGMTVFSILKSGYPFPHYLMFLIVPGVVFLGISFEPLLSSKNNTPPERPLPLLYSLQFPIASLAIALFGQMCFSASDLSKNSRFLGNWGDGLHPAGNLIRNMVQPGDTIAIWGWAPKFNVMAQIPSALRFSQCMFLLDPSASQQVTQVFLDRFFADLQKYRPKLFLDAPDEFIWPEYPHGEMARHWVLPVLSEFVRKNYSLVATIPSPPGKVPIKVYRLNE